MTNLTPATEPTVADAADMLAHSTAPGRQIRAGWRMLLPSMTPWLAIGLVLVVGITLFGVLGPLFVGDPTEIRDQGLTPPSADFPLGTTQTGQDVLANLAFA